MSHVRTIASRLLVIAIALAPLSQSRAATSAADIWTFRSLDGLKVINGTAETVTYRDRRAVHLIPPPGRLASDDTVSAILGDADFANGTIEVRLTRCSTRRSPIFPGRVCAQRIPASTSRMWIWTLADGRT